MRSPGAASMRNPALFRLYPRFALKLLWEFRWPLGVFTTLVLGGGFLLQCFYSRKVLTYPEACYGVFQLIFVQPYLELPAEWYLIPFFFLIPIIGLGAVADSIVRLAFLMFTQKRKLPEWQQMVASLFRKHVVVVGVGKVGVRIIKGLVALREPVVAVERKADSPFLDEISDLKVPVITGDGRLAKTLAKAGAAVARAVVLATDDDLANLDAALTARDLNPKVRVVMRLFDDTLAGRVGGAFNLPAVSPSQVAAPAFIAAVLDRKIYQGISFGGQELHLTDLTIGPTSSLAGRTVGEIQTEKVVNILMHRGATSVHVNPAHDVVLAVEDTILVIASMEHLLDLEAANQAANV